MKEKVIMCGGQNLWLLLWTLLWLQHFAAGGKPSTTEEDQAGQLASIINDVIHDTVEMNSKKVIRVNPVHLPAPHQQPYSNTENEESALYKIQALKPYTGPRKYHNIQRTQFQHTKQNDTMLNDAPIIQSVSLPSKADKILKSKHQPKRKNLHFLYNQADAAGNSLAKSLPVHVAPGAYPVYYVLAKTNGHFGKHPLKSFSSSRAFAKYLQQKKFEKMPALGAA